MRRNGVTIGVDVGGTKILAVAVDGDARVLARTSAPTPREPDEIEVAIGDLAQSVADATAVAPRAVGVGLPGFIDLSGIARRAPNLRGIVGVDLGEPLRRRFGVPVRVDNDANCAAWAASRVDAAHCHTMVMVTFGTGIGGGIVSDGRLVRGAHGFAAEFGHMVVKADGDACLCGQRGCWEVYASGTGLGGLARQAAVDGVVPALLERAGGDEERIDGHLLAELVRTGNPGAREVMDTYAGWVAVGIVNLISLLDPDAVVLGGGVIADEDLFMAEVRAAVDRASTTIEGRTAELLVSSLGPEAGAVGASMLARELLDPRK